jgi:alkanesulfonate monooxygenase SsuD/methylene tetrahydromethanopterin reductase-like flavin-dependent oxidoreductase (luciferase family)
VRLGAALPVTTASGTPPGPRGLASAAARLEGLGYASLWTFDAIGRGFMLPDALMTLAVAATVTERVELGTGVVQLPLRNTIELAHRALTLHHLSAGRLLFGIGPGSTRDDFQAVGADFDARFRTFMEEWPRLRRLLTTGADGNCDLTPWSTEVRLFLAAWRGPLVTRAAVDADGWIASAAYNDDQTLADALARFRDAGGRRAIVTHVPVPRDLAPAIERLHALREMGFDDAVVLDRRPTDERFSLLLDAGPWSAAGPEMSLDAAAAVDVETNTGQERGVVRG